MSAPDRLGVWADLPFWRTEWAGIAANLAADATVLPPQAQMFRALTLTQPDETRVVILGQDPYHTPGKADGLAFSIPQAFGGRLDSLGNIFAEIHADTGQTRTHTDLTDWAAQGVLLLNTALSVPSGQAGGHRRLGWERLVTQVLARLDPSPRAFLLWGGPAQAYAAHLSAHHLILQSAHPSPLSAYRGFHGSRPFSQTNAWLLAHGHSPIRWGDPMLPLSIAPVHG